MNFWDILILVAVALVIAAALFVLFRKKKTGGCSCDGCSHAGTCGKKRE